jgi:Cytochrome C'
MAVPRILVPLVVGCASLLALSTDAVRAAPPAAPALPESTALGSIKPAPPPARPKLKRTLDEPDYLPEAARMLLKKRMARHGHEMTDLVLAVALLKHETARAIAHGLATEPRLVRPIAGGEDDLNAALPERFFVLQDELKSRAQALEEASKAGDDVALAAAFGRLTEVCVGCHSAYLNRSKNPP